MKENLLEMKVKMTKSIAKCRIHIERANAELKDLKILRFIPLYLRSYAETLLKVCSALVNLQFPLMKEINGTLDLNEKVRPHPHKNRTECNYLTVFTQRWNSSQMD